MNPVGISRPSWPLRAASPRSTNCRLATGMGRHQSPAERLERTADILSAAATHSPHPENCRNASASFIRCGLQARGPPRPSGYNAHLIYPERFHSGERARLACRVRRRAEHGLSPAPTRTVWFAHTRPPAGVAGTAPRHARRVPSPIQLHRSGKAQALGESALPAAATFESSTPIFSRQKRDHDS